MKQLLTTLFMVGILLLGAWMTFYLPNAEQLDPLHASRPHVIIATISDFLFGDKRVSPTQNTDNSNSSALLVSRQNAQGNPIPLDEGFVRELVSFYESKEFPARYALFLDRLQNEKRIRFFPETESYIERIEAEEADSTTFALTVYIFLKDKHGSRVVSPVRFLADKTRGSPTQQFIMLPEHNEFQEVPMSNEWAGFTLYDIALFALLQHGV
jgi:hypothetical protein